MVILLRTVLRTSIGVCLLLAYGPLSWASGESLQFPDEVVSVADSLISYCDSLDCQVEVDESSTNFYIEGTGEMVYPDAILVSSECLADHVNIVVKWLFRNGWEDAGFADGPCRTMSWFVRGNVCCTLFEQTGPCLGPREVMAADSAGVVIEWWADASFQFAERPSRSKEN